MYLWHNSTKISYVKKLHTHIVKGMLKICRNFLLLKGRQMDGTVRIFYTLIFFFKDEKDFGWVFLVEIFFCAFPQMWIFFWPSAQKLILSSGEEMAAAVWSKRLEIKGAGRRTEPPIPPRVDWPKALESVGKHRGKYSPRCPVFGLMLSNAATKRGQTCRRLLQTRPTSPVRTQLFLQPACCSPW